MGNAVRNLVMGLVFLGSLAVLGVATLAISDIPFFRKVEALSIRFPSVDQLKPGDDVAIFGYRVGQVDKIIYDPAESSTAPILVECKVPSDIKQRLGAGTQFTIQSKSTLGGHYIEITPPPPTGKPIEPTSGFVGEAPGDLFKQLSDLVRKNERNITEVLEGLKAAVTEIRETFRAANAGEGTIGLLLKDKETRDKTAKFIADATDTVARLREDVTGEKGIVSYLLRDEKAKDSLRSAVEKLNEIVTDVKQGGGIASRLINDKELADRLSGIVEDFHDVVHKVNTGQGTLGQIVNNPKAWDELVRILVLARETIEDIREQAPVSTFVNAAFASF